MISRKEYYSSNIDNRSDYAIKIIKDSSTIFIIEKFYIFVWEIERSIKVID